MLSANTSIKQNLNHRSPLAQHTPRRCAPSQPILSIVSTQSRIPTSGQPETCKHRSTLSYRTAGIETHSLSDHALQRRNNAPQTRRRSSEQVLVSGKIVDGAVDRIHRRNSHIRDDLDMIVQLLTFSARKQTQER